MNQSKYSKDDIIYQLSVEDIQTVAEEELERKLTDKEIEIVADKVGDYVPWYDAINYAILDVVEE